LICTVKRNLTLNAGIVCSTRVNWSLGFKRVVEIFALFRRAGLMKADCFHKPALFGFRIEMEESDATTPRPSLPDE
jgi:hypothetical protein